MAGTQLLGFPGGSDGKESFSAGDLDPIPGLRRFAGEENSYPLQYSCLENPTDRGAWQATVHRVTRVGHVLMTKPNSYLGNPMERGAWQVAHQGVTEE